MSYTEEIFKTLTIKNLAAQDSLLRTTTGHDANGNGYTEECTLIFAQTCEKPLF